MDVQYHNPFQQIDGTVGLRINSVTLSGSALIEQVKTFIEAKRDCTFIDIDPVIFPNTEKLILDHIHLFRALFEHSSGFRYIKIMRRKIALQLGSTIVCTHVPIKTLQLTLRSECYVNLKPLCNNQRHHIEKLFLNVDFRVRGERHLEKCHLLKTLQIGRNRYSSLMESLSKQREDRGLSVLTFLCIPRPSAFMPKEIWLRIAQLAYWNWWWEG